MNNHETTKNAGVVWIKTSDAARKHLKKRYRAQRRSHWYGQAAIAAALLLLFILFASIFGKGYTAFQQTFMRLDVYLDPEDLDPAHTHDPKVLSRGDYGGLIKTTLQRMFPEVTGRSDKRALYGLVSSGAGFMLHDRVMKNPALLGQEVSLWVPVDDDVDMFIKGHVARDLPESDRRLKDNQLAWIDQLIVEGRIEKRFNTAFFMSGDSREPELSGILGALTGSFITLVITLVLSFPLGVATAVYLEEFAPRNRFTDVVEVNINNLAAVPSIVFGLLGLAVFINFFGFPRSASLLGGLVLSLMTLPTIIITSRVALKSVPPSIREAALAIGASPMQATLFHVLPLAMPGILTGTIIGMARALGETAPLLMIGMVAFIVDIPGGIYDPSTVLPVQIFLWADSPERAFVERTSAAIIVLLVFLMTMNAASVFLRNRFERRY